MQKGVQSGQTVTAGLRSEGTGIPLGAKCSALPASLICASRPKSVPASTAERQDHRDERASITEWLRQRQAEQQFRFASLPPYLKSDDHVLLLHQLRLVANQAEHDAAMGMLRRLSRTGS